MISAIFNASEIAPFAAGEGVELVRGQEQALLERLSPLLRRQCVTLDLGSVRRIDAAGIAALISLYTRARGSGHCFTVVNPSPRVANILSLVGLERILLPAEPGRSWSSRCRCEQSAA